MPLPTLLQKGKVKLPPGSPKSLQQKNESTRAIDYIMDYIDDRLPTSSQPVPKVKLRGPEDKVLLLLSPAGSGKSSLGPALQIRFYEKLSKTAAVCMPRISAAIESAMDSAKNYKDHFELGRNMGISTSASKRATTERAQIVFMTMGTLTMIMKTNTADEIARKYSFIIIDEVHSRSIDQDLVMYSLKQILEEKWQDVDCPYLILTSGTFDIPSFQKYFWNSQNAIAVEGLSNPIEDHYLSSDSEDYMITTLETIRSIHLDKPTHADQAEADVDTWGEDIIVFVSGAGPAKALGGLVSELNKDLPKERKILPIIVDGNVIKGGGLVYKLLYAPHENICADVVVEGETQKITPSRKVVIATQAVEVSWTYNTVRYLLETGFVRDVSFNPEMGLYVHTLRNVSRASSLQRRGRTGRRQPGVCHFMYTKNTFDTFPENDLPDMLKSDVTSVLLTIICANAEAGVPITSKDAAKTLTIPGVEKIKGKEAKFTDLYNLGLMTPPSIDQIMHSVDSLFNLGFIEVHSTDLFCKTQTMETSRRKPIRVRTAEDSSRHASSVDKYPDLPDDTINNLIYLEPTEMGKMANLFSQVSMSGVRAVLQGIIEGIPLIMCTIAAFSEISAGGPFYGRNYKPREIWNKGKPKGTAESALYSRLVLGDEHIDFLLLFEEYLKIIRGGKGNHIKNAYSSVIKWCEDNDVLFQSMTNVSDLRDNMIAVLVENGYNVYSGFKRPRISKIIDKDPKLAAEMISKIKKCLYHGYISNIATLRNGAYYNWVTGVQVKSFSPLLRPVVRERKKGRGGEGSKGGEDGEDGENGEDGEGGEGGEGGEECMQCHGGGTIPRGNPTDLSNMSERQKKLVELIYGKDAMGKKIEKDGGCDTVGGNDGRPAPKFDENKLNYRPQDQVQPKTILYTSVNVMPVPKTSYYSYSVGGITVLDDMFIDEGYLYS
jgi:hypothetical protein